MVNDNEDGIPKFNTGSLSDICDSDKGRRLWVFLNSHDNKLRMKVASDLGRPALEAVSSLLLASFPDVFGDSYPHVNRFKQMAGAMTRQVMESEGYSDVRDNVPLDGAPFSRAAKYRDGNTVDFHVWRASTNSRNVGVTLQKSANKLPKLIDGEWLYWKAVTGSMSDHALHLSVAVGIKDVNEAIASLKTNGAYAADTDRLLRAGRLD
ncbi:hypothetical protein [Achromobacter insolitus]|jgi:hypothetical protein|uniref:Uncharacterized protein n=1 Tax=Achromobacter insolitus TaxID=217204 RepID=A0A6S7F8J9_9BURK|nr:hypothetical protein [Achromobacter insolitus]CAB3937270.1 hypothetical protein LMG6000_05293 [Achromobacter insolitus]CAB3945806.1 hypothetical protein LMG5997_05727 [Achromobacter insolitus]